MMFEFAEEVQRLTDIRVVGVGGAGGNAVDRMVGSGLSGVEFLALNTDLQALDDSQAHQTMQIGAQLTQGLGSGGNPSVGEGAAEEDRDTIVQALGNANLVFVTAGMGGGTGTGAAPVVADIARKQGALTVGIVTKPFLFEGSVRLAQAEEGIARMRKVVDTLIVVPNQRLLEIVPANTSMDEAFLIADQVLYEATRGIFDIISRHDTLNLDFADVRSVMQGMGVALMGTGRATGENRALEAAKAAINSPLLENLNIYGSKAVLVNVLGGHVGLHDTAEAMQFVQDAAGPDAHVIFGYGIDENLGDTLQITVIATGFESDQSLGGTVSMATAPAVEEITALPEKTAEVTAKVTAEVEAEIETPEEIEEPIADELETLRPESEFEPEMISVLDEWDEQLPAPATVEPQDDPEPAVFEDPRHILPEQQESSPLVEEPAMVQVPEETSIPNPPDVSPVLEMTELPDTPGMPAQDPQPEAQPAFLQRAANAAEPILDEDPSSSNTRFLRPVGRRNIGEVEVPETDRGPVPISRSTASGLGPDKPGEDRATPAYIRKYMD